ncbi:uncharacterized protein LOC106159249 [Lingula anatina]|uniref:Uncharacterized protein LOC106159249 n=1 Tax=Lingula anatina TaxID=7574 RepID=A0A1S3HY15_LINAN|nr:uncharacterized protein LOC106159249 [Lingula anatina]|eukprot:XP_013390922.1 uncharacterized protein LOC106159249 [Lingula anatina]
MKEWCLYVLLCAAPYSTKGAAWRTFSIIVTLLATCLLCMNGYLVFRNRSLSRKLKSQTSEHHHITKNATANGSNGRTVFDRIPRPPAVDPSPDFSGGYVVYDYAVPTTGYNNLRRDNRDKRLAEPYTELAGNILPVTAADGSVAYNYITLNDDTQVQFSKLSAHDECIIY